MLKLQMIACAHIQQFLIKVINIQVIKFTGLQKVGLFLSPGQHIFFVVHHSKSSSGTIATSPTMVCVACSGFLLRYSAVALGFNGKPLRCPSSSTSMT